MQLLMRDLFLLLLLLLLAIAVSACGPAYDDYGYGYPSYGYAPYWGGVYGREPSFEVHHAWEDHRFGHPFGFYQGPVTHFAGAGHFGGFHGGGFHAGGFHGGGFHGGGGGGHR